MKRSLQIFTFLLVALLLLVSGVNTALDHLTSSPAQNSFTWYNEKGEIIMAYNGDLNQCRAYVKPGRTALPRFFHRTSSSGEALDSSRSAYRWF